MKIFVYLFRLLIILLLIIPATPLLWFVFIYMASNFGSLKSSFVFILTIPFIIYWEYLVYGLDDDRNDQYVVDKVLKE